MKLWIRSQDKETLMKANYLEMEQRDKNFLIISRNSEPYFEQQCLGLYKTKERAIEVLDEIQELLIPTYIIQDEEVYNKAYGKEFIEYRNEFKGSNIIFLEKGNVKVVNNDIVYEMPEE